MTRSLERWGARDVDPAKVRSAMLQALRSLPQQRMAEVMERFVDAVMAYEETTSIGPFQAFADDLTRTALLHRTPDYTDALRRAGKLAEEGFSGAVPIEEFVERLRRVG